MRKPPVNPFKEAVEEPEIEAEEISLPKLPKLTAIPIMDKPVEEIKGNGHNPDADEEAVAQAKADKEAEEIQQKKDDEELAREREDAENAKIPGSGYLFNVKKKHLPEATRLNEREVFTFAVGKVQDEVLNLSRTDSVFDIFAANVFRLKISLKGEGRSENIAVRQVDAEEKANAVRGAMTGI